MSSEYTVVLIDFANTVPHPVTAILIQCAPLISVARYALQVLNWKRSWYDAGLVIVVWWAICLLAEFTLRYLLPFVVALLVVTLSGSLARQQLIPPTTEKTLQSTVTDMMTIRGLLPSKPVAPLQRTLLRILAVFYLPYLLTTHLVPLRILLGILGTILLVARAPFVGIIISALSRSAWLRWSLQYPLSRITRSPLPPIVLSCHPTPTSPISVPSFRFLFTIYENQRWWMGLDWTAALLPNERPSWCIPEPVLQPVSPPNAFTLPLPTSVYLKNSMGRRVKRSASWGWGEQEWKVIVQREGVGRCRVERPVPEDSQNLGGGSKTAGSRLLKATAKMRESSIVGGGGMDMQSNTDTYEDGYDEEEDQLRTDGDGWVYGDNKWEGLSSKGGIGKYTRFRRWTRVAVLSEVVELVEDGPLGMEFPEGRSPSSDERVYAMGTLTTRTDDDSPLRQRLRRALSKSVNSEE